MGRSKCIIIVDDDVDDRMVMNDVLVELGVFDIIITAEDGDELLKLVEEIEKGLKPLPSIILMDINMPKKGGKETLQELRAHQLFKNVPVIIYSTSGSQKDINDSYALGANSYIIKPTSYKEILELVKLLSSYWLETASLPKETHQ